jgi:hypothetical protein
MPRYRPTCLLCRRPASRGAEATVWLNFSSPPRGVVVIRLCGITGSEDRDQRKPRLVEHFGRTEATAGIKFMKIAVRRALPRVSTRPFLRPPRCRGPRESDAQLLLTAGEDDVFALGDIADLKENKMALHSAGQVSVAEANIRR